MSNPPLDRPVGMGLRFRILERDDFTCQYCGAQPPDVRLEVDHITPRTQGGQTRPDNLITACYPCNQGKKARVLRPEVAERIRAALPPVPVKVKAERPPRPTRQVSAIEIWMREPSRPQPICVPYENGRYCQTCRGWIDYEGDSLCSCRKEDDDRYCECGEWLEVDDDELCGSCYNDLYVYCWTCREAEKAPGSDYCAEHQPVGPVLFRGGVQ